LYEPPLFVGELGELTLEAPARGILKKSHTNEDLAGSHTVIGVLQEALKEEKAREEETETEVVRRREMRKSLNRRVSFASHATIRSASQVPPYVFEGNLLSGYSRKLGRRRRLRVRARAWASTLTAGHPPPITIQRGL
jgi:hypothetical protein